jgi:hypothetical protein
LGFLNLHSPAPYKTACVIGDGFASMTSLILGNGLAKTVVLINLSKTLLVDLWFLKLWLGNDTFEISLDLVDDKEGLALALEKTEKEESNRGSVIAIQAKDHQLLRECPIDQVINIASMEEMNI